MAQHYGWRMMEKGLGRKPFVVDLNGKGDRTISEELG
jgi:hypothetical protein